MSFKLALIVTSMVAFGAYASTSAPELSTGKESPTFSRLSDLAKIKIRKNTSWITSVLNSDNYQKEKVAVLKAKRHALISEIERLIRLERSEKTKTELNMRLGRLYIEEYYSDLTSTPEAKGSLNNVGLVKANFSLSRARSLYGYMAKYYKNHPRRDEILYFYAVTSLDLPFRNEAMASFQEIATRYPSSPFSYDALVQLGDNAFDERKFDQAESFYDALLAKKDSTLKNYAMYKKGWCAYNTNEMEAALKRFQWVVEKEDNDQQSKLKLKPEALQDITLVYVAMHQVGKAIAYFKRFEYPIYRDGLESMAAQYRELGTYDAAIIIWEDLLNTMPLAPKNPMYEAGIADAFFLKNDTEGGVDRLTKAAAMYTSPSSKWNKANNGNSNLMADTSSMFQKSILKHAIRFHETGQKTKNGDSYAIARRLYEKYLALFPKGDQLVSVHSNLARILFTQGEYYQSADHYYTSARLTQDNKLKYNLFVLSLAALDQQLTKDKKIPGKKTDGGGRETAEYVIMEESEGPLPYSDVELKFFTVSNDFLKLFPKTAEVPDVVYEQGYILYQHLEMDKASKQFSRVAFSYREHPTASSAGHLMMDILNRRKNYAELSETCRALLNNGPKNKRFVAETEDILRRSELKQIQDLEEQKKYAEAGDGYLKYATNFGFQNDKLHQQALYNASVNYTLANKFMKAKEARERLLQTFPNGSFAEKTMLELGQSYQYEANFKKAGLIFEDFAKRYPYNSQAKNAMWLSVLFAWGNEDMGRFEKLSTAYTKEYPKEYSAVEPWLISAYESKGQTNRLYQIYNRRLADKNLSPIDFIQTTLTMADLGGSKARVNKGYQDAYKTALKNERVLRKTPLGTQLLAQLMFWDAQNTQQEFLQIHLGSSAGHAMETKLQRKLALLKDLESRYDRIAGLGAEQWGLGAIYESAYLNKSLANEVSTVPIPAHLSGPALDSYRTTVKQTLIDPFMTKAKVLSGKCLEESAELTIFSSWTARCFSLANELDPQSFPSHRSFYINPLRVDLKSVKTSTVAEEFVLPNADSRIPAKDSMANAYGIEDLSDLSASSSTIPYLLNYRLYVLGPITARDIALSGSDQDNIPLEDLNQFRLKDPKKAIEIIRTALTKDPMNNQLHNLLGVAYMDAGNLTSAELVFQSLISRGVKDAQVLNNLGVIQYLRGKEPKAISYFKDASQMADSNVAMENLGFLSLKYRNGTAANIYFEKVENPSVPAMVGKLVAKVQSGEAADVKDKFVEVLNKQGNDPYAAVSTFYYLLDAGENPEMVEKMIKSFIGSRQGTDEVAPFERALQEAKRLRTAMR